MKTYTRTTMTEGRLTGLALMSIENELTKTDTFNNKVLKKFKNQGGINYRRIAIWSRPKHGQDVCRCELLIFYFTIFLMHAMTTGVVL